jgi:hypothetical protein
MDITYMEEGTEVVLRPLALYHPKYEYKGKAGIITFVLLGKCTVTCDAGCYWWFSSEMILASDVPLLTPEQKQKLGIT